MLKNKQNVEDNNETNSVKQIFLGRKCVFCDKSKLSKLKNKRIKCKNCDKNIA